jgi:transposase
MRTISLDLRERILASYDQGEGSREGIARRYRVSLGMVKKLLQMRRHLGEIGPRYHRCGLRPGKVAAQSQAFRQLLQRRPDLTLEELRAATALDCTLAAIHYVLQKMGLTYKKRRSGPVNKTGPTLPGRAGAGAVGKGRLTRPG